MFVSLKEIMLNHLNKTEKKTLPESKKVNLIVFECRIVAIRFLPEIVKVRHSETN